MLTTALQVMQCASVLTTAETQPDYHLTYSTSLAALGQLFSRGWLQPLQPQHSIAQHRLQCRYQWACPAPDNHGTTACHHKLLLLQCAQAVWLLRLCGVTLPSSKEFDDPNATVQVRVGLLAASPV